MPVYKHKSGTWYVSTYYVSANGDKHRKMKRGFQSKREALAWERQFLLNVEDEADMNMLFEDFVTIYERDMSKRLKKNTMGMKNSVIHKKIVPYFKGKRMKDIKVSHVIAWQNEMLNWRNEEGKPYAPGYLKTIHNQCSAIFNHGVRFYDLKSNPAAKAGNMGKESKSEMLFWTKEEYLKFAEAMLNRPVSYYAFEMLYWSGLRMGELLALTPADFNFSRGTVRINKSYQRLNGEDVVTDPKTPKSNRTILMPDFLVEEMQDYLGSLYGLEKDQRIFPISKCYLHREMTRGCKETGVKRIRIHDLRHSHVSLLIDMGFSAVAIADRVGHESIDITYRYAHLFPTTQNEIAKKLNMERK